MQDDLLRKLKSFLPNMEQNYTNMVRGLIFLYNEQRTTKNS